MAAQQRQTAHQLSQFLNGASVTNEIENFDIVACLRSDGRYELKQMMPGGHLILLREGPYDPPLAAPAARELAAREHSHAWIEHSRGAYMSLDVGSL